MNNFYKGILSFSLGVIFSIFGSYSYYYFLSFLILELIYVIYNKEFKPYQRIGFIVLSISGYLLGRILTQSVLFHDFQN